MFRSTSGPSSVAIEPGVLHPPQVVWAVDPDRDPLDLGVRAGRRSRVEDDRSAAVLGQVLLDRTGDDPAYKTDGGDTFAYQIPLAAMTAPPAQGLRHPLLPGDPALLPPGPVLHRERHGRGSVTLRHQPVEA